MAIKKNLSLQRLLKILLLCYMSFSGAWAQDYNDYGFPSPIDTDAQRKLLKETFPTIDSGKKRLDSLIAYRKELELYRRSELEAYNEKIESICKALKISEIKINRDFASGDIAKNLKNDWDARIKLEREKCMAINRESSPYWKIYKSFLDYYKEEAKSSATDLARCYSKDDCRQRAF